MSAHALAFELEEDIVWVARTTLPSWQGFVGGADPDETDGASPGSVSLVYAPEGRGPEPLTAAELKAVDWVLANEAAMSRALLSGLLDAYPDLQDDYDYPFEERAKVMPNVGAADGFRPLIRLDSVNVHPVGKDGVPYVGFEFSCAWDEEHGLGVLMHGERVVEIGLAETAILLWIAEEDGERA